MLGEGGEAQELQSGIDSLMRDTGVVEVSVYNRLGVAVFSSDTARVGSSGLDLPGFRAALAGKTTSEFPKPESSGADAGIFTTFLPITGEGKTGEGVLAIRQDLSPFMVSQRQTMWLGTGVVMLVFAKEPPDVEHQTFKQHIACLFEKDGWAFSLIYVVTFGGFIGLSSFLPTYFHDQFGVTKVEAGQLTMLAALMGSAVRVVGGYISDRIGGINTLSGVLGVVAVSLVLCGLSGGSLVITTLLFMFCFAALGAGNGALFQLVPLRWPLTTAVAGSMIGEVGALGGGFIPNAMGLSKQYTDTYLWGFVAFAVLAVGMLLMLRVMQIRWTRTWAEKGGRARPAAHSVTSAGRATSKSAAG